MTHTVQAIAWTLIHFCWQAAAIAIAYRGVSHFTARCSSSTRYLLALGALLLMLAASVGTFAFEMQSDAVAFESATGLSPDRLYHVTEATFGSVSSAPVPSAAPAQSSAFASRIPELPLPVLRAMVITWMLGVLVLGLRSLGGWWMIQRMFASSHVEASPALRSSFRRIANSLGIHKPVLLRVSSAIAGPVTVGAFRALVLIPLSAATSLSPEQLEVVLAHELAHVRRADYFWNLVQTLTETLFFFHPAVWWLGSRIRHERELCCDDMALTVCPDPIVYASALYQLEQQRRPLSQFAMAIDGHQPSTLRMRVERILGEPAMNASKRGPVSLAAVAAALLVLLVPVPHVLASLKPAAGKLAAQSAASPAPASSSDATPSATPAPVAAPVPAPPIPEQQAAAASSPAADAESQEQQSSDSNEKGDYIDRMKAAGYDVDLDKLVAMKTQDITPDYARRMSQIGFGKLTADQLIACKVQDVTPEYAAQMKAAGFGDLSLDKLIAMKVQDVTPEYAAQMKAAGFGDLSLDTLIAMKVQDVTPEYAAHMKAAGFGDLSLDKLIAMKVQDVTPEYAAQMKAAGFTNLTADKLLSLRVQGITPEYARTIKQQFPGASDDDVLKSRIFNIDADFIADAKKHGFTDLTFDKLVKIRISGILDDDSK